MQIDVAIAPKGKDHVGPEAAYALNQGCGDLTEVLQGQSAIRIGQDFSLGDVEDTQRGGKLEAPQLGQLISGLCAATVGRSPAFGEADDAGFCAAFVGQ